MPLYEYECVAHGSFEAMRPMAECQSAQTCPHCSRASARVILTAAALATMPSSARKAHATNERSAHTPKSSREMKHGKGCGCCGGKAKRGVAMGANGAKAFPSKRPWMISH